MKNTTSYNEKARAALAGYIARIENGEQLHVTIPASNIKMGSVPSISTLPGCPHVCGGTCPAVCENTCQLDCYARKIANLRPSVLNSYAKNTAILLKDPDTYWNDIHCYLLAYRPRYFRYHVSGDIFGLNYFRKMIALATVNPDTQFLAFTKAFNVVNAWIKENGQLPGNLHVLFSGWYEMQPANPYNLPETAVYNPGDAIPENWLLCGGNCFECGCRGVGCWQVKNGQTIAFKKH